MDKTASMSFILALILSLLLLISMSESRLFTYEFAKSLVSQTPICKAVYGVKSVDTCFSILQESNLTPEEFGAINPNLVCDKLFVGQWLCVAAGSA